MVNITTLLRNFTLSTNMNTLQPEPLVEPPSHSGDEASHPAPDSPDADDGPASSDSIPDHLIPFVDVEDDFYSAAYEHSTPGGVPARRASRESSSSSSSPSSSSSSSPSCADSTWSSRSQGVSEDSEDSEDDRTRHAATRFAGERHSEVPFAPDLPGSVVLTTPRAGGQRFLQATVELGNRRHVCVYAMDPQSATITFVVTRRWSAPGKPVIVGGRTVQFPGRYNWDLGTVVDSGEETAVWVCRWPKLREQLPEETESVVDVVVEEGDYWFGLDEGARTGASAGAKSAVDKGKSKAVDWSCSCVGALFGDTGSGRCSVRGR